MRLSRFRLLSSPPKVTFDGLREQLTTPATPTENRRDMLRSAQLRCQEGGPWHTALHCLACARLVTVRPVDDRILIRCLWRETDPVAERMTLPSELLVVPPDTHVPVARELAWSQDRTHIVVGTEAEAQGIVSRCALDVRAEPGERVSDRMERDPWALPGDATLGDAVGLMQVTAVDCVPIVGGNWLLGLLTRDQVLSCGVPEEILGPSACLSSTS